MATDVERLIVALEARTTSFERALRQANGSANRQARSIERRFQQMNRTLNSQFSALGGSLVKAFAFAGGVRGAQTLIDTSTQIQNALKVAGLEGENLAQVYDRLFASAQRNAAPLETLVTLYGRAALVQKELNVSQEEMLDFTDRVAMALRVAGTDAQSASGALLQLSQALGSGVVRAEEFNSILEGALPIAQAAAAGLTEAGGSVAKLRQLVVDGKVSSEAFFRAFEAGSVILEEKVAGAELTVSQHLVRLRNVLIDAAGDFEKGSGAAESFGKMLSDVADIISEADFTKMGEEIAKYIGWVNDARKAVLEWLGAHGAAVGRDLGLDSIGEMLTSGAVTRQVGPLTITSSRALQNRIDEAFGGAVETASELTEQAIIASRDRTLGAATNTATKTDRIPKVTAGVAPVSLADYDAADGKKKGSKKGAKERADDYDRLSARIADSTAALIAETEAQRGLNPLIEDYGYAAEKARTEQELLNAAKKAGITVTPELRAQIAQLADQYAVATVEAAKLAEQQDKTREAAEKWMGVGRDVTKGLIDDLVSGTSAAESFANAISKIGDALVDDVLSSIFKINNAGSGGFLSSLFGGIGGFGGGVNYGALSASGRYLFEKGGYTGPGGKRQPAGVVHKGEVVWSQDDVARAGGVGIVESMRRNLRGYANGGPVALPAPAVPRSPRQVRSSAPQQIAISVDVTGARGNAEIMDMVSEGVQQGLRQYDREVAPVTIGRVIQDPHARG